MEYVDKKQWKKSAAQAYQPAGGYFETVYNPNNPTVACQVQNLTHLRALEKNFNERSKRFCLPDADDGLAIDEILVKSLSFRNPMRTYNKGNYFPLRLILDLELDYKRNKCNLKILNNH